MSFLLQWGRFAGVRAIRTLNDRKVLLQGGIRIFRTITYLESGNDVQRRAFEVINELDILNDMREYTPILCGTIPISIHIESSDLDIIMEVHEFDRFMKDVKTRYGRHDGFMLREAVIHDIPSVIANFQYGGFQFELFGQPRAVEKQNAYLHMIVEHHLLMTFPHIRTEIIRLKELGMKTEPAFAQVLGLVGDPYDELIILGTKLGLYDAS